MIWVVLPILYENIYQIPSSDNGDITSETTPPSKVPTDQLAYLPYRPALEPLELPHACTEQTSTLPSTFSIQLTFDLFMRRTSLKAATVSQSLSPRISTVARGSCCPTTTSVPNTGTAPAATPPRVNTGSTTRSFSSQPSKMSTMQASHGHSQACCNVPPVVSKGYKAKGSYEEIGGYKTCKCHFVTLRTP